MILRALATLALLALLGLNWVMPFSPMGVRGSENKVRADVTSQLLIGKKLPPLELVGLDGRTVTGEDLRGHRVLLTFERSADWCPYTKTRLLELREAFGQTSDLRIVWVMSDAQINDRTRSLIGELGLADRILFLADPKSRLIRELGILKENPEAIEIGVPHPTTLVLDRSGTVQFVDVRENYHIWLDPKALTEVLGRVK
jgi:peroxiredoxin